MIVYDFAARDRKAQDYKQKVKLIVNAFVHTQTGRCLLNSLNDPGNPDASVWIMPYNGDAQGVCQSTTDPFYGRDLKTGKTSYEGIKIRYSPERFQTNSCGWWPGLRPEETLFHELVHASRLLRDEISDDTPLDLMGDYEEFVATLATNMFRSERGAKLLNRDYVMKEPVSQATAELFLSSHRLYLEALDDLADDELVKALAKVATPFNPFRDLAKLKAAHSDIAEFLTDLNPVAAYLEAERIKKVGKKLTELQGISTESSNRVIRAN